MARTTQNTTLIRKAASALRDAGYASHHVLEAASSIPRQGWDAYYDELGDDGMHPDAATEREYSAAEREISAIADILDAAGVHDTPVHEMRDALTDPYSHHLDPIAHRVGLYLYDVAFELLALERE